MSDAIDKIEAVLPNRWDADALRTGAMVTVVFAIPFTVIAALIDSESGGLNFLLFFGAMLGFVLGAGCAAWVQRVGRPLSHGIVTASATFLAVQAVLVIAKLIAGSDINWLNGFFPLTITVVAGLIGGMLGNRLQVRGFVPSSRRNSG